MGRILALGYGIVCYTIFFVTFLYFFGFTGDFLVPKSVSAGEPAENLAAALLVNLGLWGVFSGRSFLSV